MENEYIKCNWEEENPKPDPKRAEEIQKAFALGRIDLCKRIWPDLNSVFCITSGSFKTYSDFLEMYEAKSLRFMSPAYMSSESCLGINPDPIKYKNQYCLTPDVTFYEFLPIDDFNEKESSILLIDEIEIGKMYEMIISNQSGLYRYRLGDLVRVVSFHENCPVIEPISRDGMIFNLRAEKVCDEAIYCSLQKSIEKINQKNQNQDINDNLALIDFTGVESPTFYEIIHENPNSDRFYILYIEAINIKMKEIVDDLACLCDQELKSSNEIYKSFRDKEAIQQMKIFALQENSFSRFRQYLMARNDSKNPNQTKIPRRVTNPEIIRFLENLKRNDL